MKNFKSFINSLFLFTLLLVACQSDEISGKNDNETPIEIVNNKIDIQNDSQIDFAISEYEIETHDIPSSAGTKTKFISPLNQYSLLTDNNGKPVKHQRGDTITVADFNQKKLFKDSPIDLISISRKYEVWDEEWLNLIGEYVVFKNSDSIGWFKFQFDLNEGTIKIINHKISHGDFITLE